MAQIIQSVDAKRDISDIACYIAQDKPSAAERWLDSVDQILRLISKNPDMGESVDYLKQGLRRYVHGRYLLFYLAIPDGILLYRVLHGARPIEELLS